MEGSAGKIETGDTGKIRKMNEFLLATTEVLRQRIPLMPTSAGYFDENKFIKGNRSAGRVFLGITSFFIVSVMLILWVEAPSEEFQSSPAWFLLAILLGIFCLILAIKYRPENFWIVAFVDLVYIPVYAMVFHGCLSVNSGNDIFIFSFVFSIFSPLLLFLVVFLFTGKDPLPITSPFLRIAYPVRFKHLKGLHRFATEHGWKVYGLAGLSHKAKIVGGWNGHEVEFISGREHGKRPAGNRGKRNYVAISMKFQTIPWNMSAGKSASKNSPMQNDASAPSTPIKVHLSPPQDHMKVDERSGQELYTAIAESAWLIQEKVSLYTTENILIYQAKNINLFADQHNIQIVLNWMDKILRVMETNGLTSDEEYID